MIDLPFGIDIARYASTNGQMDFKIAAKHKPLIRFMAVRAGISWGYEDSWFSYHWQEIPKMPEYRDGHINDIPDWAMPVGRCAYHVIYPSQPVMRQTDNLFRIIGNMADWEHDQIVIDAELDQDQGRYTITNAPPPFSPAI